LSVAGTAQIDVGDAIDFYETWPTPSTIVSDGAYGIGGFPGDPRTPEGLAEWYRPHVEGWSKHASLATTLWFWNTEVGWANVHPLLLQNGWHYEFSNTWNKGVGHVAGNVNGNTIRRFPTVTEVCVFYTREPRFENPTDGGALVPARKWLLDEWKRTGLPIRKANEACGVKDAATRKYFDQGWLWYWPPPQAMARLVEYANAHGSPEGRPYYSLDGHEPITEAEWSTLRSVWNHVHGVTNVWDRPALHGNERYRGSLRRAAPRVYRPTSASATHLNQKPLDLMERIIRACTVPGDIVWEPFGGLCSATIAALALARRGYAAEIDAEFAALALERAQSVRANLGATVPLASMGVQSLDEATDSAGVLATGS
jgi:site-specific DNA-methyltransferase (adenine-specific)